MLSENPKQQFRAWCKHYLPYIRRIALPQFPTRSKLEAVLVEYRELPHLEFILRNNIIKLGNKWCHTVICGNLNHYFVASLCASLSTKIKVIRTDFDNLTPSEYSRFVASDAFWDLLTGDKILLYQEDSILFRKNIDDFLSYDYIGAPWPSHQNDTKDGVGNGGLSLRTRQIMKTILSKRTLGQTTFNTDTIRYITNTASTCPPEDVYFSKSMDDLGIGKKPDWLTASFFSQETVVNPRSLGGHCFWLNDPHWKRRLRTNNVVQFRPHHDVTSLEHRGGWRTVIETLQKAQFFREKSTIDFYDMVEAKFLWDSSFEQPRDRWWSGVVHCTANTPPYLDIVNISKMFESQAFLDALSRCLCLFTLSPQVTQFVADEAAKRGIHGLDVYTLKHPCDTEGIVPFDLEAYTNNAYKCLLQIGQQLRKMTSLYLLPDIPEHKKVWLTGTRNFEKCEWLLQKECEYLCVDMDEFAQQKEKVDMVFLRSYAEYDRMLSKNVVFVDLFDAAANNTVLECIVRNTPIFVSRLEAVADYLGHDYPLFFNQLSDVPKLLTLENIDAAHKYLAAMDKRELSMDYFAMRLMTILHRQCTV